MHSLFLGTVIWYYNPPPGHLIHNNTAISVYGTVNEIRCYSGDTNSGNTGTTIISPSGNTPLQFSNVEAGYIKKSSSNNVGSVNNGVYTCKYVDGGGTISESSFAVYSKNREPGSGSGNTGMCWLQCKCCKGIKLQCQLSYHVFNYCINYFIPHVRHM